MSRVKQLAQVVTESARMSGRTRRETFKLVAHTWNLTLPERIQLGIEIAKDPGVPAPLAQESPAKVIESSKLAAQQAATITEGADLALATQYLQVAKTNPFAAASIIRGRPGVADAVQKIRDAQKAEARAAVQQARAGKEPPPDAA